MIVNMDRVIENAEHGYSPEMQAIIAARRAQGIRQSTQRGKELPATVHYLYQAPKDES